MGIKSKIAILSLVATVAASSVYAFGGAKSFGECERGNPSTFMKNSQFSNTGMKEVMMILSDMDLSKNQWQEIRKVMFDLKEQRLDKLDGKDNIVLVDKNGNFDKEKFIKDRTSMSKDMIEVQAKAVEKVLSVLSETQRKTLASKISI